MGERLHNTSRQFRLRNIARGDSRRIPLIGPAVVLFKLRLREPYSIEQKYIFYALEFGNEQITGIDIRCLYQQVHGGVALYDMAHRLWPEDKRGPTAKRDTRRPRIMGPLMLQGSILIT